ncbi:MAG: 50S ribosomal protein L11 [Nanoarchaeota archaeon]
MAKQETLEMIVEGGKAATTPAVAQKLGPMKIPIPNVMNEINKKTSDFKGMKIPVKVTINPEDKSFSVEVGSPSVSELIKKEIGLEKGSGTPNKVKASNIAIEQLIKIAKMKHDALLSRDLKASMKQVAGSCGSLGVLVEGKLAHDIVEEINSGKYDNEINSGKTEVPKDKLTKLKDDLDKINLELKKIEEVKVAEEAKAAEAIKPAEGAPTEAPKEGAAPTAEAGAAKPAAGKEAKPGAAAPAAPAGKAAAKKEEKKPAEKPKK